jgi:hypothetical protein
MHRWLAILALLAACGGGQSASTGAERSGRADAGPASDGPVATVDAVRCVDGGAMNALSLNRNRLLATYLAYLQANPTVTQTNGLNGARLNTTTQLWNALDPSSQAVFLTLTARLQGGTLMDGSSMLDHITRVYRVSGGMGATATSPGTCGGGEYNRMIMSMDPSLQAAQLAANTAKGAVEPSGKVDITDIPPGGFWRDSHDPGGPHSPFDLSDETNDGAPRGQTQYFSDPTSTLANTALGRQDLATLIDPYALEMDQDYDCPHNSNPLCPYIFYGLLCAPQACEIGTAIWTMNYGDFDASWRPAGC